MGISLVVTFFSTIAFIWDETFQAEGMERPKLIQYLRLVPWYWWVIPGLIALVFVIVEHAHSLIGVAEDEADSLRNPDFTFRLNHDDTPQILDNGQTGIHRRISVLNSSDVTASNCKMVINTCSVSLAGFTRESALPVKDGKDRVVVIIPHTTELFDLVVTFLHTQTNLPERSHICTSTWPRLPLSQQDVTLEISLTGESFSPRQYLVTLRCGAGNAEIVDLQESSSES